MKLNIQLFASKNATMSGDSRYYITLEVKETSYSTANNTSNVSYSLKATKKSGSGYYSNNAKNPIKVTINGSVKADTKKTYDFTGSTPKTITLASGTVNGIQHNADGSKTISCSASFTDKDNSLGSASVSFNLTLTKINRGATLTFSSNPIALGETLGIDIDINSGGSAPSMYTYNDLYVKINNVLVDTIYGDINSATWTPPLSLANYFSSSQSGSCKIVCETYELLPGSQTKTIIGTSQEYTLGLTIPASVVPTVTIGTPTEADATMISKNWGCFVQGKSKLEIPLTPSGVYGSTIQDDSTYATVEGSTYNLGSGSSITTKPIQNSGTLTISATTSDSRQRTGTSTNTDYSVIAYSNPILDASCEVRWDTPDAQQSKIRYDCKGSISSVNNNNAKTFKLKYKKSTETTYQEATIGTSYTIDTTNQLLNVTLDTDYSYDFKFEATDSFTTTSIDRELDTGFDLMNFNSNFKAMAIGKVSEAGADESLLEIALPTQISEDVTMVDGAEIVGYQPKLTAGTNITIDANNVISASGGGGGTATDVQINGTTITSNNVANIVTQSTYNASTNKIATKSDIPTLTSQLTNNSGYITNSVSNLTNYTKTSDLSSVATSGSYNDLSNKPTIPTVNNATLTIQKNGTTVKTFTANASSNVTANITVPTKTSDLTNDDNVVKDASYVHTDNNYTTTEKNKLSGIASGAEVNVQSDWNQTDNTKDDYIKNKPTIPTVNNATLTIQKNSTTIDTFTANASSDKTINISVPTKTSDITNDSGFITNSSLSSYVAKTGDTMSGKLTVPQIETGTGADNYFQTRKFRGEGNAGQYYHAIDFGYSGHNQVDLYEYGGVWNFWKNTTSTATTDTANQCLGITQTALKNQGYTYTFPNKTGTFAMASDIPTNTNQLTNGAGFITKSVNNLDNYTLSSSLKAVATSGSYSDLTNKPTIPTKTGDLINNGDGSTGWNKYINDIGTYEYYSGDYELKGLGVYDDDRLYFQTTHNNSNYNEILANLSDIPYRTSELTNDSGYISSAQSTVGSTDRPVYLNNGTPTQTNTPASGGWFRGVPFVTNAGVMEIGRYIDFHPTNDSSLDFSKRLDAGSGTTARTLTLPDKTGTIAITSDIPTNTNQLTNGAGFITSSGSITGNAATATKATGDKNGNDITTTYQPKLTAGTNITIDANNVISASGGGGGGTATTVKINGTSITSGNVADIKTNGTYNASSNKIATMSDIPSLSNYVTNTDYATMSTGGVVKISYLAGLDMSNDGDLQGNIVNYNTYGSSSYLMIISKGTLENVLKGYHIEPTILYDNSSGSKKTITGLNDSISNYTYLEIFYGWEGLAFGTASTRYDIALGGTINLGTSVLNNNAIYWGSSEWTPNGTTLTLTKGEYWRLQTTGSGTRSSVNNIAIYKILGYK